MKRIAYQFTNPTAFVILAVVFLVTIAFASANFSYAASDNPAQKTSARASKVDRTEARITDLHARLKITPAQEDLWNQVTQVMRDDAKKMDSLNQARYEKARSMTAVEDLKSYGEIAQAHADGLKNFIPVFETLYAALSDDQKKDADTLFRQGSHHKKSKAKSRSK